LTYFKHVMPKDGECVWRRRSYKERFLEEEDVTDRLSNIMSCISDAITPSLFHSKLKKLFQKLFRTNITDFTDVTEPATPSFVWAKSLTSP